MSITTARQGTSPWLTGGLSTNDLPTPFRINSSGELLTAAVIIGGAGSTDVTAKQGLGSSLTPWHVLPTALSTWSVMPAAASTWTVQPAAGAVFGVSGATTAIISTVSKIRVDQPTRTQVAFVLSDATPTTVDALTTLGVFVQNFTTLAASSVYTVTAGKTLRLQSMTFSIANATTAGVGTVGVFRLRVTTGVLLSTLSPVIWSGQVSLTSNAAGLVAGWEHASFPDGIEIPAGGLVGVSYFVKAAVSQSRLSYSLVGYES